MIEHERFRAVFGEYLKLADDNTRKDFYGTAAGGHRLSVSIGSRTAGFDADLILCDDLHDMASRNSQAERDSAKDYFETALLSRLVPTGRESVVLSGHRVHEADVYADLRDRWGDWTWLVLDAEHDPEFTDGFPNSHWIDPRAAGELLWPERIGPSEINNFKRQFRNDYWAVFQQRPTAPEGSLFKGDWFRFWKPEGEDYRLGDKTYPLTAFTKVMTVDLAIGTKANNDWTVAQIWAFGKGQCVLLHQRRERVDGARVVPLLTSLYRAWRPSVVAVEDVAYQRVVIDQLRSRNVPVKPVRPTQDKESRSVPAQIRAEAGQVWLPEGQVWVTDWLGEVCSFPHARHDDQVDALSMAMQLAERWAGKPETEITPAELEAKRRAGETNHFEAMLWADSRF